MSETAARSSTAPLPGRLSVIVNSSRTNTARRGVRTDELEIDLSQRSSSSTELPASATAIRQQLTHMLRSPVFIHSEKLSRFLRFVVEHVICGTQSCLKEYVIGSEVYDRKPPYNPGEDSIVRTEARRLRGKLKEYYESKGNDDPIRISLLPGSYIPAIHYRKVLVLPVSAPESGEHLLPANTAIAILPFRDLSGGPLSSTYARGIPDELAYTLMRTRCCKVISPASMAHFNAREHDVAAAMSRAGANIAYEGSVREEGNRLRVTATIVDASGLQLWTRRFDTEAGSQPSFHIEEEIACALSAGLDDLFGATSRRLDN